jgi:YbbR domain-containing protein
VRRALHFLLRNWPLKLGAILLATVLYSGLVLSQNVRAFNGNIPIEAIRQPPDVALLTDLPPVTQVRYRAPLEAGFVSPSSFSATVNLADVEPLPAGAPVEVPVTLIAFDRRVQVIDFFPRTVQVRLDPVDTRTIGVTVEVGAVPEGVTLGPPQVDPQTVDVRGPSTRVAAIRAVLAPVAIDASGLNVDRQVDLQAVDEQGNQVTNVEIEPPRARVRIAVGRQLASRTLPVVAEFTGSPPAGYRIATIAVTPSVVTVTGESSAVTQMDGAHTEPISLDGRTRDFEMPVALALPEQVTVTGSAEVNVTVSIVEKTGTRSFQVGVGLVGARSDRLYVLGTTAVDITLGGSVSQLNALDPAALVATVNVAALDVGVHTVPVDFAPTGGLNVVSISPAQITVTVQEPSATPSASP